MKKRMLSFLAAALLLACLPINAFAREVPDMDKQGSIEVTMKYGDKAVSGGTLTATKVGEVVEDDGDYFFVRLDGEPLADIPSPDAPGEMESFAKEYGKDHLLSTQDATVGKDGKATFSNLELGLYLITQKTPAPGYNKIGTFLVSVPYNDNGHYVYDVDINAKSELEREPNPTTPSTPTKPTDPKLPQTGQLTWPIPVLAAAGLLLLVVGFVLRRGKKHEA